MTRSRLLFAILPLAFAVQHLLGVIVWREQLWGTHSFAYLPAWLGVGTLFVFALATLQFLRGRAVLPGSVLERAGTLFGRWTTVATLAVSALAFWLLRIRHDLLGDALPLTHDLPSGIQSHPRQPLTMWLQQRLYQLFGPLFSTEGKEPADVAADTVALGSVICGVLFVLLLRTLTRWLAPVESRAADRRLFALLLLCQGSALLFFGYLENYTLYFLGVAAYVLCGIGFLQRRLPLAAPGVLLALLLGLHLSSFVLWPSFVYLLIVGARDRERRLGMLRDLMLSLAAVAALGWALTAIEHQFNLFEALRQLIQLGRGSRGLEYLFSAAHLRDWFEEQMLAGPITVLFFAPALAYWLPHWKRDPAQGFLVLTALTCLAATFAADEPMLGYARDWDLFLPAIFPVTLATATLGWHAMRERKGSQPWMGYLTTLSFLAFLPWLLLNISEARSLERMADLPLGLGRAAVVVGNWHLREGDQRSAQSWFERALDEHPFNNSALSLMGNIHLQRGEIEQALEFYERAIELRPRKIEYRERITRVLMDQGRFAECAPHFEALLKERPGDGSIWLRYAQALRGAGQVGEAERCYRQAATALEAELRHAHGDYQISMDLGTVYASLGEPLSAEKHLLAALTARPESPTALYQLAGVLVAMGRPTEARPYLDRLLRIQPDHPQHAAIVRWLDDMP
jgi:tetratricopeptide (TPR) repeat protein